MLSYNCLHSYLSCLRNNGCQGQEADTVLEFLEMEYHSPNRTLYNKRSIYLLNVLKHAKPIVELAPVFREVVFWRDEDLKKAKLSQKFKFYNDYRAFRDEFDKKPFKRQKFEYTLDSLKYACFELYEIEDDSATVADIVYDLYTGIADIYGAYSGETEDGEHEVITANPFLDEALIEKKIFEHFPTLK